MMIDIKYGLFKYEVKDYYSILGVPIDATAKDIRLRYLKIAYQLHPDTCQVETPEEKEKASQILSKLVNPAYENLYKDKPRKECQLIFSEIGRRLADDIDKITVGTDIGKTLLKAEKNREKIYHELVTKIAAEQYQDLRSFSTKIAFISELNMVYLMLKHKDELSGNNSRSSSTAISVPIQSTKPVLNIEPTNNDSINQPTSTNNQAPESPVDPLTAKIQKLIRNAEEAEKLGKLEQGILELREAIKLDNSNSKIHAMIASFYFQQNNTTYGKIHLNKASSLNPNEPLVKKIKEDLKQAEISKQESSGKSKGKTSAKGKKTGKDGKKEPPKIFGIPLW